MSETLEAEGQVVSSKDGGRASFVDCSVYDAARNFRLVYPYTLTGPNPDPNLDPNPDPSLNPNPNPNPNP